MYNTETREASKFSKYDKTRKLKLEKHRYNKVPWLEDIKEMEFSYTYANMHWKVFGQ